MRLSTYAHGDCIFASEWHSLNDREALWRHHSWLPVPLLHVCPLPPTWACPSPNKIPDITYSTADATLQNVRPLTSSCTAQRKQHANTLQQALWCINIMIMQTHQCSQKRLVQMPGSEAQHCRLNYSRKTTSGASRGDVLVAGSVCDIREGSSRCECLAGFSVCGILNGANWSEARRAA